MAGTYLGAWSSALVSGTVQLTIFALVMIIAAYFMLKPIEASSSAHPPRPFWQTSGEGLAVGVLTGFVGVGGGFLIVPALVVLGGLSMHRAVATSLVIIALKSLVGFLKYQDVLATEGLALDYEVIATVALLGTAGSFIGAYIAKRLPKDKLKRGFGVLLIVMGIYILAMSGSELMA